MPSVNLPVTIGEDFDKPETQAGMIWSRSRAFRLGLNDNDKQCFEDLTREMVRLRARMEEKAAPLLAEIEKANQAGTPLTQGQLARMERYQSLLAQLDQDLVTYAGKSYWIISGSVYQAVALAKENVRAMTEAGLLPTEPVSGATAAVMSRWHTLPSNALTEIVGAEVVKSLSGLNYDTKRNVQLALMTGVALGHGQAKIGKEINNALGGHLGRAMTIARTENHRAQREATRLTYEANSDIVKGWTWRCARTARTCPVCWAMDGQEFTTDNARQPGVKAKKTDPAPSAPRMHTHVNCRCTMVPLTRSWAELGYPGIADLPKPKPGAEVFKDLPESVQRQILGPGKYAAYKDGHLALSDLVGGAIDDKFGKYRYERSLKELQSVIDKKRAKAQTGNRDERLYAEAEAARQAVAALGGEAYDTLLSELTKVNQEIKDLEAEVDRLVKAYKKIAKKDPAESQRLYEQAVATQHRQFAAMQDARLMRNALKSQETNLRSQSHAYLMVPEDERVAVNPSFAADMGHDEVVVAHGYLKVFESFVSNPAANGVKVEVNMLRGKNQRSYQSAGGIYMGGYAGASTWVHEMGHWLEGVDKGVHEDINDFLSRRTKGQPLVWLGEGYAKDEKSVPDNFIDPYVGKWYGYGGTRVASEVLSMGLEAYVDRPVYLARKDPEMFNLIYVAARGGRFTPPPADASQPGGV